MVRQGGLETLSKKHTPSSKVPFPSFCTLTAVLKKTLNNMLQISSAHRSSLRHFSLFVQGRSVCPNTTSPSSNRYPQLQPPQVRCTDSTSRPTTQLTNFQRFLAMIVFPLIINTPDRHLQQCFQQLMECFWHQPSFVACRPRLGRTTVCNHWIGADQQQRVPGAEDPSLVQDDELDTSVSEYFTSGGTELNVNTLTGASWYILNTAANALPTDGRWLVAQITTAGDLSGTLNAQMFPLGVGANQIQQSWDFAGGQVVSVCDGVLTSAVFVMETIPRASTNAVC